VRRAAGWEARLRIAGARGGRGDPPAGRRSAAELAGAGQICDPSRAAIRTALHHRRRDARASKYGARAPDSKHPSGAGADAALQDSSHRQPWFKTPSDRRIGAPVDHVLAPGDRCRGSERGRRPARPTSAASPGAKRDFPQVTSSVVPARIRRRCRARRDRSISAVAAVVCMKARRNAHDPDALWPDLVREALAVVAERRLPAA